MLVKSTPRVNVTNILRATFSPICEKVQNQTSSTNKGAQITLVQKISSKNVGEIDT